MPGRGLFPSLEMVTASRLHSLPAWVTAHCRQGKRMSNDDWSLRWPMDRSPASRLVGRLSPSREPAPPPGASSCRRCFETRPEMPKNVSRQLALLCSVCSGTIGARRLLGPSSTLNQHRQQTPARKPGHATGGITHPSKPIFRFDHVSRRLDPAATRSSSPFIAH